MVTTAGAFPRRIVDKCELTRNWVVQPRFGLPLQPFDQKVVDKQLAPRADVDPGFLLSLSGEGSRGSQGCEPQCRRLHELSSSYLVHWQLHSTEIPSGQGQALRLPVGGGLKARPGWRSMRHYLYFFRRQGPVEHRHLIETAFPIGLIVAAAAEEQVVKRDGKIRG